jgi:hypothetical protein
VYASSGVINNPLGGQIDFSFPPFFKWTTLKGGFSYQTNLDNKQFINGQFGLHHLAVSCDFDADAILYSRNVKWDNNLNSRAYSAEANLNFRNLRLLTGYSYLNLNNIGENYQKTSSGLVLGLGTLIDGQLRLLVIGKAAVYKDKVEYIAQVTRESKWINAFIKFYKLDSFTELSLGIGTEFGYRVKRRKK